MTSPAVIQPPAACDDNGQHPEGGALLVGVCLPCTPSNRPPDGYVDRDEADYQLAIGNAESIDRGKAIRLVPAQRRGVASTTTSGDTPACQVPGCITAARATFSAGAGSSKSKRFLERANMLTQQ